MKKFVLAAIAAAAAASFSGSALAVDLSSPLPVPDNFASELVVANVTPVQGTKVITDLGFGVSATQTRFIRYDFTNARFAAPGITAADLVVAAPGTQVVVSSGGAPSVGPQVGPVSVIFQITAPAAANIAQDADVTLTLAAGLVPTDKQPIQATYRLFETAAAAVTGNVGLAQDSGTIIVFGSGVALTAVPATTTVDVASTPGTYTKFLPNLPSTTTTLTRIGTVALGTGNALTPAGVPVALSDFLGAGAAITLKGTDLLPAILPNGLSLQAGPVCAAGGAGIIGTSRTASTASFLLPNPLPPGVIAGTLCFEVAGANPLPIAAQVFTADVFPGVLAGVLPPDVPEVTAGTFVRNGLVLKTAFAETNTTNANGFGSSIHLSNNSGSPAPFTVKCVLPVGSVAGTPGSVPANSAQRFSLSRGLGCPSNGTLRGVEIIFEATEGSVIGSVVRQNLTTGQSSFDSMTGNK